MIAITPKLTIQHGPRKLLAGESLIVEDVTAGEILLRTPSDVLKMEPPGVALDQIPKNGLLLVVRPGGLGDVLFLTPVLAEVKRQRPDINVTVATFPFCAEVLENNADVDSVIPYPVPQSRYALFDGVCWLENALEFNPDAERRHIVDLFADRLGVRPSDKACKYFITEKERQAAGRRFPKRTRRRIGIQVKASQMCRTYPAELLQEVINLLLLAGDEVFLFDRPGGVKALGGHPNLVNLTIEEKPLSFRESCAVLDTCDGFIAPDSALCHIAGALGKPTIGLYGAFPWELRTAHHPSVYGMNGKCPMGPCFHHERGGQRWPEGGPCETSNQCEALAFIKPERIVSKLNQIIK